MKRIITLLMVGAITVSGAGQLFASAATTEPEDIPKTVESQLAEPQDFSGMVAETEEGVVLKTADGIFMLEGMDVTGLINKEVVVTGVLRSGEQNSSIFVMKAEVKG